MSVKAIRHKFLRKYPIVIVDENTNWCGGLVSENYYQKVKFTGRPLSYILLERDKAEKIYGRFDEDIITTTMAIIVGEEKYPANPKLALKFAMEKTISEQERIPFDILRSIYELKYGECPIQFNEWSNSNWKTPHQTNKLGDQFSTSKDIEGLIDRMEDDIDVDSIDEAVKKPVKKPIKKSPAKKKVAPKKAPAKKPIKKAPPKKKVAPKKPSATMSKTSKGGKHKGYTHVSGGDGKLYIQGEHSKKEAQAIAHKSGATHREQGGKIIPLSASEMIGQRRAGVTSQPQKKASSQTQQKRQTGGKPSSSNTQQKKSTSGEKKGSTQQSKGGEQQKSQEPIVVRTVKAGSKEHKAALDARPLETSNQRNIETASLLNEPYSGKKKRDIDPEVSAEAINGDEFKRDTTYSDAEFAKKNKEYWVNPKNIIKLNSVSATNKVPKHTIKTLERVINTVYNSNTKKLKDHFAPEAGAGDARSQAGELMVVAMSALDEQAASRLKDTLMEFIDTNAKKGRPSIMEASWVESAFNSSRTLHKHLSARFGEGNYEITALGWDTRKEFEAMTGLDYFESKGSSSDMYLTVATPEGDAHIIDVTLKKDLDIKLLNSGPNAILDRMDGKYDGTDLDVSVFISEERKWLKKIANTKRMETTIDWLKKNEKNINKIEPKGARDNAKLALESLRKIGGKNMDIKKIMTAISSGMGDKEIRKAAWCGIYAMSEAGVSADAKKVAQEASKLYSDYAERFMDTVEKDKDLHTALMDTIRENIPLNTIAENLEVMIMGLHAIDRATMEKMFGTADPKKIKDGLVVVRRAGEPPFVGYAAGTKSNPVPVAKIRFRPEALGYGNRIKFDLDLVDDFKAVVRKSNNEVYDTVDPKDPANKKKK